MITHNGDPVFNGPDEIFAHGFYLVQDLFFDTLQIEQIRVLGIHN